MFAGDWDQGDWVSGIGMVSRWPLEIVERRKLRGDDDSGVGEVLALTIGGDRGPVQFFAVMLDYPLGASAVRQAQVRELTQLISSTHHGGHPTVVCGDFNAGPDSDEIRMLTGKSATGEPGLVFYDAWEVAGDGTAGITWSNRNPLAAVALYPDRRFDYVLSAWPRRGGVGHPTHCELLGVAPHDQLQFLGPLRSPRRPPVLTRTRGDLGTRSAREAPSESLLDDPIVSRPRTASRTLPQTGHLVRQASMGGTP